MFGNLFEEEGEEGLSSTSSKGRIAKRGDEPPSPRGRSNLCGIKNQGGTCYLNSLLQTLLFTPEFRGVLGTGVFSLGRTEIHQRAYICTIYVFFFLWCVSLQRNCSVWGQRNWDIWKIKRNLNLK